jgi:hypothetical protein
VNKGLGISRRRARLLLVRDGAIQEALHTSQLVGIGDVCFVACIASIRSSLVQQKKCIMNGRKRGVIRVNGAEEGSGSSRYWPRR